MAHHGDETDKPFAIHTAAMRRPCCSFMASCCFLVAWLVLLVLLSATGNSVLEITTDVPMYLRDHRTRVGSDAIKAGKLVATTEAITDQPKDRELKQFSLDLLFVATGDNIFTEQLLTAAQHVETAITSHEKYEDYCALVYDDSTGASACARPLTALDFFDPEYFLPVHQEHDSVAQDGPLCPLNNSTTPPTCVGQPTSGSWKLGNSVLMRDSKIGDESIPIGPDQRDLTENNVHTTTHYWSQYSSDPFLFLAQGPSGAWIQQAVGNAFRRNVGSDFGTGSTEAERATARAVRSVYYWGAPLPGYNSTEGDDLLEQEQVVADFLFDAYEEMLEEARENNAESLNVLWRNVKMQGNFVQSKLVRDASLVIGAVSFVLAYMSVMTKSLFIGAAATSGIFLCFPPSMFLYRYLIGFSYFGTLQMLAVFILLGIGCDDIILLLDTYSHTTASMGKAPIDKRMTVALKHAASAMLATSLTTAAAFSANATSSFPAVYTFGAWCATLVCINFLTVCLHMPHVIIVHELRFKGRGWCCPCLQSDPGSDSRGGGGGSAKKETELTGAGVAAAAGEAEAGAAAASLPELASEGGDSDDDGGLASELGAIELWFANVFYPRFIHRFAKPIVAFFFVVVVIFGVLASQIQPDPDPPQLFPEGNNYVEYMPTLAEEFSGGNNPSRVTAEIVFGIDSLDRTGTVPTDATDYGKVVWDEGFLRGSEEAAQEWTVSFCSDMRSDRTATARAVYPGDDIIPDPIKCWAESFRDWVLREGGEFPVPAADFRQKMALWLQHPVHPDSPFYQSGLRYYDVYKPYMYAEGTVESSVVRFFIIPCELTITSTSPFDEGIAVYEEWESWLHDRVLEAPSGFSSAFVTDAGRFHYYFLQDAIVREAITGIGVSLAFAFVILLGVTQNVILSVYAVLVIAVLVIGVVAFTVMRGWQLGVLEAVVYVMIVGMAVDHSVHLSHAYLAAKPRDRHGRTRSMLMYMAVSVIGGAFSTLGASTFLLFGFIAFFAKFGSVMWWIIASSLVFSLVAFAALLDLVGPEGDTGTISFSVQKCCARASTSCARWLADEEHSRVVELQQEVRSLTSRIDLLLDEAATRARRTEEGEDAEREVLIGDMG